MFELILPTRKFTLAMPVILDVVDVKIPPLLGLNVVYGKNLLINNVNNHLGGRKITNMNPPRFEDIWKIKLIRKGEHLYVTLSTHINCYIPWHNYESFINNSLTHQQLSCITC